MHVCFMSHVENDFPQPSKECFCYITVVTKSGGQLLSVVLARSSEEVRKMIDELDKRFSGLKKTIRDYLERSRVLVKDVADVLTSLSPDDDEHHKIFLESHVERLYTAVNHSVLFGTMNFHWNYLDPSLLDTLVKKLDLKEIKAQMDGYKSVLQRFRMKTPLSLFCRAQKRKRVKLSPEFHEVVAHFTWPEDDVITLEAVEVFRQEYASHFNLREFAMMLAEVRPGSFIVMWLVPKSIVDTLKGVVPRTILIKNFVTSLKVAGTCIYCIHKEVITYIISITQTFLPLLLTYTLHHSFSLPGVRSGARPRIIYLRIIL